MANWRGKRDQTVGGGKKNWIAALIWHVLCGRGLVCFMESSPKTPFLSRLKLTLTASYILNGGFG